LKSLDWLLFLSAIDQNETDIKTAFANVSAKLTNETVRKDSFDDTGVRQSGLASPTLCVNGALFEANDAFPMLEQHVIDATGSRLFAIDYSSQNCVRFFERCCF
jgi:hypothetical protein